MIAHTQNITNRLLLYAGIIVAFCTSVQAATVYINQNPGAAAGASLVGAAQLRASTTQWDMALSNGRGFTGNDAVRADLATVFSLPSRTYTFSLSYFANQGFVFRVRDNATGAVTTQSWGTFASPPGGTVVATLRGRAPLLPFDAIQIEASATTARASTTYSNLVFTSADLNTAGSFYGGTVNDRTQLPGNARGTATQELLADVNLGAHSWQLSGDVTFMRALMGNANDVTFTVNVANLANGAAIPAPEPSGVLLLAGAAGMMLGRRRRK